jgi:hypothetical protein
MEPMLITDTHTRLGDTAFAVKTSSCRYGLRKPWLIDVGALAARSAG